MNNLLRKIIVVFLPSVLTSFDGQANEVLPEVWFNAQEKDGILDIKEFQESPMLSNKNLPLLEERLPKDPVVSFPLRQIGTYGGTARAISVDASMFFNTEGLLTISPDHKTILPNLAKSWQYSDDGMRLTVYLREGLKWSDGHPLTAADCVFMMQELQLNPVYQPVTPRIFGGLSVRAVDELTVEYEFARPSPLFINYMAQIPELFFTPKHYFKQFHPNYVDAETLKAKMRQLGFINWSAFVRASLLSRSAVSINMPTVRAFVPVRYTPTLARFERNAYYFKVDPKGNQLPYIDVVEAEQVSDNTVAVAKASNGQLDFAAFYMPTQDIPLLKLGEQTAGTKVLVWRRLHGSDLAIQFNFNHANPRLRELYWDVRFRRALSIAINRDEMNQIIYFGRGVPRQVTVIPESDYFEPGFANAYTEFDPDTAREMLDAMGLRDIDGDGLREHADGSKLTLTIEFVNTETPKQISMELVTSYWQAIGIDARLKLIDRGLQYARAVSGEMEMSVWHADRTTDVLFPITPDFWVPRVIASSTVMWNEWTRWYVSEGETGEEPPPEVRQLQAWAEALSTSMDPLERIRLGKNILAANAENVWSIGTIGLAPHPVVISARLKNVKTEGLWGWDTRWTLPYHPSTWYLDQ